MNQHCYGIRSANGYPGFFTDRTVRMPVSELKRRTRGTIFDTITRQRFTLIQNELHPSRFAGYPAARFVIRKNTEGKKSYGREETQMIRLIKARHALAVALVMLFATTPATIPAQTAMASEATSTAVQVVEDTGTASALDPAVEVGIERRVNELRRQYLDDRAESLTWWAESINWWLAITAIALTFFGIVVAIAGFIGYGRLREIEQEARKYVAEIKVHKERAEKFTGTLVNRQSADDPDTPGTPTDTAGQAEKAVVEAQRSPDVLPTDKAIANAYALQNEGKKEEAIEKWRSIAKSMDGTDNEVAARAWLSIGFLLQEGAINEAISAYDRAIQLNPNYAAAYYNRGNAKMKLEQHIAAILDYDQAIRLSPHDAATYNNRGNAKMKLEQHIAAILDYDQAIQLNPHDAAAYYNRGNAEMKLEQYAEAITDYDQAIQLNPRYAADYNNRGIAKSKLEQHIAAILDYDQAIRLNPNDAAAYYNRGVANAALGRIDDARTDLKTALHHAQTAGNKELTTAISNKIRELAHPEPNT